MAMLMKIVVCHPKWKDVDSKKRLAPSQGCISDKVYLFNNRVCHRIAANRDAVPMHHQRAPCLSAGAIVEVGKAEVEGEVVLACRIHLLRGNKIEALGAL